MGKHRDIESGATPQRLSEPEGSSGLSSSGFTGPLGSGRLVASSVVAIVLILLVVLASRPYAQTQYVRVAAPPGASTALQTVVLVAVAAGLGMLAVLLHVLFPRLRRRGENEWEFQSYVPHTHWATKAMFALAPLILLGSLIYAAFTVHTPGSGDTPMQHPSGSSGPAGGHSRAQHGQSRAPSFDLLAELIAAGVVASVVGYGLWLIRPGQRKPWEAKAITTEQLSAALADSLDDVLNEENPRRAVIAAYARMEGVLAAHGLPRRRGEAPLEYVSRVLGDLEISPQVVHDLTELFELARFSRHDIGMPMRAEAIEALRTIRGELRSVA